VRSRELYHAGRSEKRESERVDLYGLLERGQDEPAREEKNLCGNIEPSLQHNRDEYI